MIITTQPFNISVWVLIHNIFYILIQLSIKTDWIIFLLVDIIDRIARAVWICLILLLWLNILDFIKHKWHSNGRRESEILVTILRFCNVWWIVWNKVDSCFGWLWHKCCLIFFETFSGLMRYRVSIAHTLIWKFLVFEEDEFLICIC